MTNRKLILIIGMVDSIHLANWLRRFQEESIDFHILPSRQFRRINPRIIELMKRKQGAHYSIVGNSLPLSAAGYWDFLRTKALRTSRSTLLKRVLKSNSYEFIHALEIQHAGYLLLDVESKIQNSRKLIVTNWGSDIYYFAKIADHRKKIEKLLSIVDAYSAECLRDYKLARNLGFSGRELPLIPNSFNGVEISIHRDLAKTSNRKQIIVKGYGGEFGLAGLVVQSLEIILTKWTDYIVVFYSVTKDIEKLLQVLQAKYPQRVKYFTVDQKLSPSEMVNLFTASRIYIGCSLSDGISTSFLESMNSGAYPIQSNTSCVDEWIANGAIATTINPVLEELTPAIDLALRDDELVNRAQEHNLSILKKLANINDITTKSREFYFWD